MNLIFLTVLISFGILYLVKPGLFKNTKFNSYAHIKLLNKIKFKCLSGILLLIVSLPSSALIVKFAWNDSKWDCQLIESGRQVCELPKNQAANINDVVRYETYHINQDVTKILGTAIPSQATSEKKISAYAWYNLNRLKLYSPSCTKLSFQKGNSFIVNDLIINDSEYLCIDDTNHIYTYEKIRQYFGLNDYEEVSRSYIGDKAPSTSINFNNAIPLKLAPEWNNFFNQMQFCFGKDNENSKCYKKDPVK
ncbi:MAG: hypothetical protein PSV35_03420 [bacterium]|nr:hypothetical protein [bacterium]